MLTKNWHKKINHDIYFINEIRFEKLIWYDKQLYIVKDGSVDNGETHLRTDKHLHRAAALSLRMWFHCKSKTLRVVFSSLKKKGDSDK